MRAFAVSRFLTGMFAMLFVAATATPAPDDIRRIAEAPAVRAALAAVRRAEAMAVEDQIRLCEIPAPPFQERARAQAFADLLRDAGLQNVRLDREGNVVGERPGRAASPAVVIAAHLDTVFPPGTPTKVRRAGAVLHGPGIGDDCRGLALTVSLARALAAAGVQTESPIVFAGTVGEEGLGNLRGMKALLQETLKGRVASVIAVDGSGYTITNVGVGSRRYRATYRGPGGHSYNDFGRANPAHALGRALAAIADLQTPATPKTTFSVGRIGGGTSVNAIPSESWAEIDLRSSDVTALAALDARVRDAFERAAASENTRWKQTGRLSLSIDALGDRPAGRTDENSTIVETAVAVSRFLGVPAALTANSTDANVPMQMGIAAIALSAGGTGSGVHTLQESYDTRGAVRATERALLLMIALAGLRF